MGNKLHTVYTAQYRYSGPDRVDITVKGQHPTWRHFAPTWDMVMGVKKGSITEDEYIRRYLIILDAIPQQIWGILLQMETITFVCFCKEHNFCHRNIVTNYICSSIPGIGYGGWRV